MNALLVVLVLISFVLLALKIRELERRIKALEDKNLNVETEYGSWENYKRTKESWKNKEG